MYRHPTIPGRYWWTEWQREVDVYFTRQGNLCLRAPNGKLLRVKSTLPGQLLPVDQTVEEPSQGEWLEVPAFLRRNNDS